MYTCLFQSTKRCYTSPLTTSLALLMICACVIVFPDNRHLLVDFAPPYKHDNGIFQHRGNYYHLLKTIKL